MASQSLTYEALGTTWKVHRELIASPGLRFIQDYFSSYDFSELEWVTLKPGGWGYATYPEEEIYGYFNAVAGYCHYPAGTRSGLYRVNSRINMRLGWPAIVYQREPPLYLTKAGTWPDVPDDCFTGKWFVDERSGREWKRLKRRIWVRDEREAVVYILAHELFHFLRRTRQISGKNVEIEADRYGVQVLEAYRVSSRDGVPQEDPQDPDPLEPVTDTDTLHCEECGMALSSSTHKGERAFCSDRCRWTFHNRMRARPVEERTCEVCGKEFVAKRSDAKTCSPRCRQKARRQRSRSAE